MPDYTMTIEVTRVERFDVTVDAESDAEARRIICHDPENYDFFERDRAKIEVVDQTVKVIRPKRHPKDARRDFEEHPKTCEHCSRVGDRLLPCSVGSQLLDDMIESEER